MAAISAWLLGVVGRLRLRRAHHNDGSGISALGGQRLDEIGRPRLGGLHIDAVDIDALHQPSGSQRFQPFVKEPAGIAELFVGSVAEGEHGEPQMVERLDAIGAERLPEQRGVVRKLALAPR